jgi:hypothetical protein
MLVFYRFDPTFLGLDDTEYRFILAGGVCTNIYTILHLMIIELACPISCIGSHKHMATLLIIALSHLLILPYSLVGLKLLDKHLAIFLLIHLTSFFHFLVLLVPAPLVDLRLCQTCILGYTLACFFCPVRISFVFSHQVLHLVGILSNSPSSISVVATPTFMIHWHTIRCLVSIRLHHLLLLVCILVAAVYISSVRHAISMGSPHLSHMLLSILLMHLGIVELMVYDISWRTKLIHLRT